MRKAFSEVLPRNVSSKFMQELKKSELQLTEKKTNLIKQQTKILSETKLSGDEEQQRQQIRSAPEIRRKIKQIEEKLENIEKEIKRIQAEMESSGNAAKVPNCIADFEEFFFYPLNVSPVGRDVLLGSAFANKNRSQRAVWFRVLNFASDLSSVFTGLNPLGSDGVKGVGLFASTVLPATNEALPAVTGRTSFSTAVSSSQNRSTSATKR